jgi:hypothetical protein
MAKYECKNCNYKTNHKANFEAHLNRKIRCNKNKLHKNIKETNNYTCRKVLFMDALHP